jgi:hypothetical protein
MTGVDGAVTSNSAFDKAPSFDCFGQCKFQIDELSVVEYGRFLTGM